MNLPHTVTRSILIEAELKTVFRFFTEPALWASWWGAGSTVDPRVGGAILIRHSNGFQSTGEVLEIVPGKRFVFTFSMQADRPIPPEESRVTLELEPRGPATLVTVRHDVADEKLAALLPQGWRFHFSLFANAVANHLHADAEAKADAWFALWTEPDAARRAATLETLADPGLRFGDRYSCLQGIHELVAHIGASQKFMPGIALERRGKVRHCLGTALAGWAMVKDGKDLAAGTNVFVFNGEGKIVSATGVAD